MSKVYRAELELQESMELEYYEWMDNLIDKEGIWHECMELDDVELEIGE